MMIKMKNYFMNITSIIRLYLEVNYSGQKIGNPWNVQEGLVNVILMKLTIVFSGVFIGLILLIGVRSKLLLLLALLVFVLSIWKVFKRKLESKIDFYKLELSYTRLNRKIRIIYFMISIMLLICSVFLMVYLIKWILMLR